MKKFRLTKATPKFSASCISFETAHPVPEPAITKTFMKQFRYTIAKPVRY